MADRVASDHPDVATVRATVVRAGRTDRKRVAVDAEDAHHLPTGEVVRLVLDGDEYFVRPDSQLDGEGCEIRGAYDRPDEARDLGSAPNRLTDWFDDHDRPYGGSVLLDVVDPGHRYGLREPGARAVYDDPGTPDDGLASIARNLQDDA